LAKTLPLVRTLVTTLPLASITGTSGIPAEKPPIELKYSADILNAYSFIKYLAKNNILATVGWG
jgi:hypothetical protein